MTRGGDSASTMAPCSSSVGGSGGVGAYPARVTTCPAAEPGRRPRGPGALDPVGPRALPHLGSLQLPRRKAPRVKVKYSQVRSLDGITEKLELDF